MLYIDCVAVCVRSGITFSPTDNKLATCADDSTVRVWDFWRCEEERVLRGHGADVRAVHWHPSGSLLASGSRDPQQPIKLWDPRSGRSFATVYDSAPVQCSTVH